MAMKEEWILPDDELIKPIGKKWLLQLLNGIPSMLQARTMLIFWRIWHNHNEMTHDKPCPSLEGSRRFLVSYLNSLLLIKQHPGADMEKGKMVITQEAGFQKKDKGLDGYKKVKKKWIPPEEGRLKLNVDGAFSSSGGAGAGTVLRDHQGTVVAAACRALVHCRDATEAELLAIEDGLRLALLWSPLPFTVETDSSEAAELIKETTPNTSIYAFTISAIGEMLQERDISVIKISRDAKRASHELAKIGRVDQRTAIWFVDLPLVVSQAIELDCNPSTI
jgi:ribonuclease HI